MRGRMFFKRGIRNIVVVLVLLSNIGCDQLSKNLAREHMDYGKRISIVADYLSLIKVENTGAFLSIGNDLPNQLRLPLLVVVPALFLLGLTVFILYKKHLEWHFVLPMAFVIGGGIGNLVDRMRYGSVTDFLHMDFQLFQTGIFNLADVSIMIGTFWMLLTQIRPKSKANEPGHL